MNNIIPLNENTDKIWNFLKKTHPLHGPYPGTIEIRPLYCGKDQKFVCSHNIFNFRDKDKERFETYLTKNSDKPISLYFSIYSYDYNKQGTRKDGKAAQRGRCNADVALYTQDIVLDFDDCNEEKMRNYNTILNKIGIFPIWIFSGHGYQANILLDSPCRDKNILSEMVDLFYTRGFEVDLKCRDAGRIMRLPYTYNYKKWVSEGEAILTSVVIDSDLRFSTDFIIAAISALPIINILNKPVPAKIESKPPVVIDKEPESPPAILTTILDDDKLPSAILDLFSFCDDGYRHDALGFLTQISIKHFGFDIKQTMEIMTWWNNNSCNPPLTDFSTYFQSVCPKGTPYTKNLCKKYGYLHFKKLAEIKDNSSVQFYNSIFYTYKDISTTLYKTFAAAILDAHDHEPCTVSSIADRLNISTKTAKKNLDKLVSISLLQKNVSRKRDAKSYTYTISKIKKSHYGYISMNYLRLDTMLQKLTDTQFMIYIFLISNTHTTETKKQYTYSTLAKILKINKSTIARNMEILQKKKFLEITKTYEDAYTIHCNWILKK